MSATMLSSPLREHILVRTPGRWRVFGIFHERTVRSDQGTEQWFRNEAGEESRAPDVSWDCTCGFGENLSFILWALGRHRRYFSREKYHPLSGFRNSTSRWFVQQAGRGQARISGHDTAASGLESWLPEEDKGPGRADSQEFMRRQTEQEGGGSGSREEPGVAARFQQGHTRKGGAPSTPALDLGWYPPTGSPPLDSVHKKPLPSHPLYGLHAIRFHRCFSGSYYVPGTRAASPCLV